MTVPQSIALVDLSCLFKKNFMASPGGEPLEAAEKTLGELALVRESVEHVILCLDSPPYDRRRAIFPAYKAQRPPITDAERAQKKWLYDECKRLGYQMARVMGEEADDVVATLAKVYGTWCPDVRLVGADKDLAQCVTANVRQLVPAIGERPAELRGPERVLEKFGVLPEQMALYLALVGDKSDNIPGVPGIGPVNAITLIAEHKNFFNLGEAATLRPKAAKGPWRALQENWPQLEMCLELTTLKRDLPLATEDLLVRLEPAPVETMGSRDDMLLDGLMGNETPVPPAEPEAPKPIIGADPNAGEFLRQLGAKQQQMRASVTGTPSVDTKAHVREQDREEKWRKEMREENEAAERLADNRDAANDQKPPSGPRPVTDAEFDPIGKSPGASGPMPPKPSTDKALVKTAPDYGLVTADLQPQDLKSAEVISKWLKASELYPQFRSAAAIFAVIMRGKELGLGVTTALAGFHVVEGKPTASADLIRALATRSPKCKYFRLVHSDDTYAEWETLHADHPAPTTYRYTIEEAIEAGLMGGNWKKRKRDMLTKTAAAKLARIVYPGDVLGLYAPEEFNDGYNAEAA